MADHKKQTPWETAHFSFGFIGDDGTISGTAQVGTGGTITNIEFDGEPLNLELPSFTMTVTGINVIFPQRYVMYIPQPPAEPIARAIFASKADADRYLEGETVQVQWQALENGQWVDYGELSFQYKKYEPPSENEGA